MIIKFMKDNRVANRNLFKRIFNLNIRRDQALVDTQVLEECLEDYVIECEAEHHLDKDIFIEGFALDVFFKKERKIKLAP